MMKSHGSHKCEICLVRAKINLAWASNTTERKIRKKHLGEKIPPAKYHEDGVHVCGSCKDFLRPSFMLSSFKNQLKVKESNERKN